jgi:hypothetical protein
MKAFSEFESWPKIVSRPQASYTWGYYGFLFSWNWEGMGSEICFGGNSKNCITWIWGIVKFVWGNFFIHIVAKKNLKGFLSLFELLGKGGRAFQVI